MEESVQFLTVIIGGKNGNESRGGLGLYTVESSLLKARGTCCGKVGWGLGGGVSTASFKKRALSETKCA